MRPKLDGDLHQIGAADASNYGPVGGGPGARIDLLAFFGDRFDGL